MPANPLTEEQLADARRLKAAWQRVKAETGLTQAAIAHECNWDSQSTVSQYINGKIPLNIEALQCMAKVLNVPMRNISPSLCAKFDTIAGPWSAERAAQAGQTPHVADSAALRLAPAKAWPFSEEVLAAIRKAAPEERSKIEAAVRSFLGLKPANEHAAAPSRKRRAGQR